MRTLEEQLTINRNCKFHPESKEELQKLVSDPKINLGLIDTSKITDMSDLFFCSKREDFSGIEKWDVANVTDMHSMFAYCYEFNQPLNDWDVSSVKNMEGMFYRCKAFNQPLDLWNTSKVTDMSCMFTRCEKFNQDLNTWDVSCVENMSSMFWGCKSFNQPLNDWNVSNVTDMYGMFDGCKNFNQDLTQWKVKETCNTQNMFTDTPLRLANVKEVFTEKQLLNSASQIFLNELTLK